MNKIDDTLLELFSLIHAVEAEIVDIEEELKQEYGFIDEDFDFENVSTFLPN